MPQKLFHLISILITLVENHSQDKTDQSEWHSYQCGILEPVCYDQTSDICPDGITKIECHLYTCTTKHLSTRSDAYDQ